MGYRQLKDTKTFLSTNLKMLIAKTKLTPLLFFGVQVFGNCYATSQHKLLVAFNNVARYIFNRRGTDRISDTTFKIFDKPLKVWIEYKTLVLLHKVITTYEPKYLFSKLPHPLKTIKSATQFKMKLHTLLQSII